MGRPAAGMVLLTIPAVGGPALQAVVQPDHSVKWFPVGPPPAPATAEEPAAAGPRPRTRRHKIPTR